MAVIVVCVIVGLPVDKLRGISGLIPPFVGLFASGISTHKLSTT